MNVRQWECFVVSNDVSPRTGVSILYISSHSYVLVKLTDEDGISGWGETYASPGTFAAVGAVADTLVDRGDESLRSSLRHVRFSAGGISGGGFANSALALALEDLRARKLGISLSTLYGGAVRDDVRAYAASGGYTEGVHPADSWPAELERAIGEGFTALKFRVGGYPIGDEAAILEGVRAETPDGFDLMADGNAAYVLPQALEMGAVLTGLGFRWYEEPMAQRGYVDYPELTRRLTIAVAAGEGLVSRPDASRFLVERCADIVQPDPVICGGVGEALFIAEMAAAHGIMAVPHTSNSAVGITAGIHVAACTPNATRAFHGLEPVVEFGIDGSAWRTALLTEPHVIDNGRIRVPTGAGLGVEIDEDHIRHVAVASSRGGR
jgi:D-galactarolactone cycloisomerase